MDLAGRIIAVKGRFDRLPRKRLTPTLARLQINLERRFTRKTQILVLGHRCGPPLRSGTLDKWLATADERGIELLSEHQFLRLLDLMKPLAAEPRPYTGAQLMEWSGLSAHDLRLVTLLDVIEADRGQYGFRDLKAARIFARLLTSKDNLADAIDHAQERRRKSRYAAHLAELDLAPPLPAEYQLTLGDEPENFDEVWDTALSAHLAGDYRTALDGYRRCAQMRPRDSICLFNLASILSEMQVRDMAASLLSKVIVIKPDFAEAWLSLSALHEGDERMRLLERAVAANPGNAETVRTLAAAYTEADNYSKALPLWERFIDIASGRHASVDRKTLDNARRALLLCRMDRLKSKAVAAASQ